MISAVKAFLLAALIAAVTGTLVVILYAMVSSPDVLQGEEWTLTDVKLIGLPFLYFLIISTVALCIVAFPATVLLSRLKVERSWVYPFLGFITAIGILLLFADRPSDIVAASVDLVATLGFGAAGAAAGFIWWSLYRVRHANAK